MNQTSAALAPKPSFASLLQAAIAKLRAGRPVEAEPFYRAALARRPLDFDALRGLGLVLLQQHRGAEALPALAQATRVQPKHAGAWTEFGVAHAFVGRFEEALGCYERALSLDLHCAEAFANKGDALAQLKRSPEALACYDRALALNSRLATVHSNRGGLLRELGHPAEALASLDQALRLAPGNADALSNRGDALVELGRLDEALASYDKAIAANPHSANAHNNRGNALLKLNRPAEALASYDRALTLAAPSADTLANRGHALKALRRADEALACFAQALALAPRSAATLDGLAGVLSGLNRFDEALACHDHALICEPERIDTLANRATVLIALKRFEEALASCDRALTLAPNHAAALNNRGAALAGLARESEAIVSYDAAIAVRPDFALAHVNKGVVLERLGRFPAAREAFETAIPLAPGQPQAYYNLSLVRRFEPDDPLLAAMERLTREDAPLDVGDRVYAHFAYGKALADLGEDEGSFRHIAIGNALKRGLFPYDEAAALGVLTRTRFTFTQETLARRHGSGARGSAPIFIVGMPRSGTTLVEQILASHPLAHGAGEISDLQLAAGEVGGATVEALFNPEAVLRIAAGDFGRLGENYLRRIQARAPTAQGIVNKALDNIRYAGLIALALPEARIVHVRRDPIDTCLSCFTNMFADNLAYACDLGELGRYYRGYETLMVHWRGALPPGMMIEVRYEDVVADLEGESRRLLAHCGLDWDPRCLDFHKSERSVRTASVAQVRQPIYGGSVGRSRRYERFLGPLIEALGASSTAQAANSNEATPLSRQPYAATAVGRRRGARI